MPNSNFCYFPEMDNFRFGLFKTLDHEQQSKLVLDKLRTQNGIFEKIKNTFKYGRKVNRILTCMKNSCVNYNDIEDTKPDFMA